MTSLQPHKRVQQPRGPSALNDAYIGLPGQFTIDSDRQEVRLHDGVTPGGHRIPNLSQLYALFVSAEGEAGGLDFDVGEFGAVFRVGEKTYSIRTIDVEDGLTIANADGVEGNPKIGLPGRLDPIALAAVDANEAEETGFYRLEPTSLNLPVEIQGEYTCTMLVMKHSDGNISQFLIPIMAVPVPYRRTFVAGVWKDWIKLESDAGTYELLKAGEDATQRTWSSEQLNRWLDAALAGISNEDSSGVQSAYTVRKLFTVFASGNDRTPEQRGPYTFAVGDRAIITAFADTVFGLGNVRAHIALNLGGTFETVKQKVDNIIMNPSYESVGHMNSYSSTKAYITKTATGVDLCDEEWGILKSFTGTWNGEIEVSVAARAGASTAVKYKLKA